MQQTYQPTNLPAKSKHKNLKNYKKIKRKPKDHIRELEAVYNDVNVMCFI